jgi:hypothetical protein
LKKLVYGAGALLSVWLVFVLKTAKHNKSNSTAKIKKAAKYLGKPEQLFEV